MRRTLLFCTLFALSAILHAQKNVVIDDSTYANERFNQPASLRIANAYFYNENCLDTLARNASYGYFGDTSRSEQDYTYYPGNSMQTQIYRIYTDTPPSTPVNVSRHTYTYTPASYNYVNNYDRWQNNDWQQSAQATVTYLDKDKPLLFFNQVWNSTQGAYINSYQQVTSYNDRNLQTNFSKQTWDTTNSRWITTYSFISLYNGQGLHTSDTLKTTPRTGDSVSTARYYTYYTNIEGRVDSSYEVGMQLQDSTLNDYTYYAQSGKLNRHIARFFIAEP